MKERIHGLYAIVDNTLRPELDHVKLARSFLAGGARTLQLRMKGKPTSEIHRAAKGILSLKKEFQFLFIVNDALEVVRELGADGYHGGKDDPSIEEAQLVLGGGKIIGYSAHSLEEALDAERRGADYVAFGAIFPSLTKDLLSYYYPIQGIAKLKEVVSSVQIPVVAIGGINRENIQLVLSTGVASFAMISAFVKSASIESETRFYMTRVP